MTLVLSLSLLGPLQLRLGAEPVPGLISAKAQALLCYLAVTGRPHSRQALAGLLWGDLPEADARRNLRGEVLKLRQDLAPYLRVSHHTLAFNPDSPHRLDVATFKTAVPPLASPFSLQQAITLYRGDFLEDFHLRQAAPFEAWVMGQRAELRELMLGALQRITAVLPPEEAIPHARRWLSLEPSDEAAHRQLMRLLALSGQRSAALAQYDQCRALLQAELGLDPSPETTALHDQIRGGLLAAGSWPLVTGNSFPAPHPPRPPAPLLPHSPTPPPFIAGPPITHPAHFFGRERELKRIFHLLRGAPLQNAAIVGPRRSGKTSLLHYLKGVTTAVSPHLRPDQTQTWLPHPEQYRWVFIDFQDTRLGDPANLLPYLLGEMGLTAPAACDLDHFLDIVSDELRQPTVILLDEIGVALQRYPLLDDAFWESLRSLATNQVGGQLAFILAAAESPDQLAGQSGHGSPFFNIFGYVAHLGPLSEEAARALIASSPLPFAPDDAAWILAESGRWPMCLQILCRERLLSLEEGESGDDWRVEALRQMAPFRPA